jgi:hypothetical protein
VISTEARESPAIQNPGSLVGDRALAAWEITSVVSSVLIAAWILAAGGGLNRMVVTIPVTLAFLLMIASHRERGETPKELGLRFDNFVRALLMLLPPMIVVTVIFLLVAYFSHSGVNFRRWSAGSSLILRLVLGFGWGFLQQYVLQAFINRRTMIVFGRGWRSVLLVAAIFAGLHLPNIWLASITFAGGLIWAAVYQRTPNLFALAVSHALMTWVVISSIPPSALHHLRVGFSYFM